MLLLWFTDILVLIKHYIICKFKINQTKKNTNSVWTLRFLWNIPTCSVDKNMCFACVCGLMWKHTQIIIIIIFWNVSHQHSSVGQDLWKQANTRGRSRVVQPTGDISSGSSRCVCLCACMCACVEREKGPARSSVILPFVPAHTHHLCHRTS